LLERGELRGARAAFVRAGLEERARELEQQAHDAEVAAGLAELAQMRERCEFDRAIEYARRLAERYPDAHENWTALFDRIQKDGVLDGLYREGVAALEAGDSSTAQALLSQVASIDPHYRDVSRYLYVAVHGEDPAARVKPPAEEADEPVTPIAGETVEAQEVAPSEGRSGRGVALLIAAAAVAAILWAFGDRAPAPVPERSPTKQAAPVETPAPTPSPKEAPVVEPPPREPVEAPTIGPAPAPAPAAAADGVDISELLARGWAALRGLDPVEVSAVERELLTAIHDRKRGLPGAEQLAEARILRAELLLTRALTTAIVRTIDPRMIDEDDVARAEEELARASAELAEVDDEALRGSVAQRRGRVAALRALVAGEPLEVALDLLPTGSPEDIRALILHASLWRAPESLTRDELAAVVERLATLAAADDGRVIDLLHGLALYRLFRRTRLADDKRRARQVVLPLRDALPDERIGWALHRALTRRPAPRGIQGVYKVVRADIKRSCGAPKSGERVRVRLDVKPRAGAVLFTAFVTGRPDDAAFATCLKDRLSKLRYQRFTEDALDGAEMEFMASEPDAP
ncbi:MAG: hypothetical protein KC636_17910, partial [Myxococcales bacterium]|nr:hypothetical protein [Myxococcales bacterium]